MIGKGNGVIVNVGSISARNGGGPGLDLLSRNAAVSAITKGLAKELAPKGVRVNAVSPGTVDNHFHEVFSNEQILDNVVARRRRGRWVRTRKLPIRSCSCVRTRRGTYTGKPFEINGGMLMVQCIVGSGRASGVCLRLP